RSTVGVGPWSLPRSNVFFSLSGGLLCLHSFPTRRSSDLLALAAFLGALVAGLLGRGLRLGRLGSRCRGDWILRFGMERGAGSSPDRKSTRLNSSPVSISYAVFCLKQHTEVPRSSQ